ncbi:MAG: peptidoglycan bridge formation glycyltransferase FemA/FemB family protein [Paludibacteraceae bacterium]|nr:peptidoglycan bridge formation glycyltransferase FemA/FemB family protein [Paludibacteraceae bacterium]
MKILTKYDDINRQMWSNLVAGSKTSTWFQTPEAYEFYASLPNLFEPFVIAVENDGILKCLVVGYITQENNKIKQFLSRRAIIVGGPLITDDTTPDELELLLSELKKQISSKAIYIETRNLNDYSKWKDTFLKCGFKYEPHLNFHVDCTNWEKAEENIGKHRKKYIRLSLRDGASIIESPTIEQITEYYSLLDELYKTKVKMPLQPFVFFEKLYYLPSCKYLLIEFDGRIVGGSVCMLLEGTGVYEWYACGKDGVYKNIHSSSVTKYAGMKYAADNGYPIFDMMGAGKPNEEYGVRDFKAEFGGKLVEYGRFCYICKPLMYKIGCLGLKLIKIIL